jgi:hypothetical protein
VALCHEALSVPVSSANSVRNTGRLVRNPYELESAYRQTLRKYNAADNHLTRRDRVEASLLLSGPDALSLYRTPVTFGEGDQARTLWLQFDTGSQDLWVLSVLTDGPLEGDHPVLYDPRNSTTAVETDGTWDMPYLDGTQTSGIVFNDTVTIGGVVMKNQAVGVAINGSGDLFRPIDGLLGLSLGNNTIKPGPVNTVVDNLFNNPHMPKNLFTVSLTRPNEPEGFYTFGYIDDATVGNKTIQYFDVQPSFGGYWQVSSEYIIINGNRIARPGNKAVADTGTTLILLSDDILPTIYQPVGGVLDPRTGMYLIPTSTPLSDVPTITLPVGTFEVEISVEDALGPAVNSSWAYGGIQSRKDATADILGDHWLRNVYAIFDIEGVGNGPRLGVVQREKSASANSSTASTGPSSSTSDQPKKSGATKAPGYDLAFAMACGMAILLSFCCF